MQRNFDPTYNEYGVRFRLVANNESKNTLINWLFLPGGPGLDASCLLSLVSLWRLPGRVWLMDLPGNGSNSGCSNNFDDWLHIFPATVSEFSHPVLVGHSFGGMFPLLFPEMEDLLDGLVLLGAAPSLWLEEASLLAKRYNLPDISRVCNLFTAEPTQDSLQQLLDACVPYHFPASSHAKGREILCRTPCSVGPLVWWERKIIEMPCEAGWIPYKVPTLIIGGELDTVVPASLFTEDIRFQGRHIQQYCIQGAGHWPWVEQPEKVKKMLKKFVACILPGQ